MKNRILALGFSSALALGWLGCGGDEPSAKTRPEAVEQAAPKIFFFSPPAGFRDREQYWADHHYVATFGASGPVREGMVRFERPYLNFSQSAWDPGTGSLFTWKKNYKGRDHLMRVALPSMDVEPVSRFPVSGGDPLLALDTKRRRILVAPKYGHGLAGLRGGALVPEFFLYDLEQRGWRSGRFEGVALITVSYSEALDRFLAFGKVVSSSPDRGGAASSLFHIDADGRIIEEIPTNLLDVLETPIVTLPRDSLSANSPGVQSRVLGDRLYLVRYVDLGRESPQDEYDWSYEVYSIDPSTGDSRFVRSFR